MAKKSVVNAEAVRAWAVEQGLKVGGRGLISRDVIEAFNKANPKSIYEVGVKAAKTVSVTAKAKGRPPVRRNVVLSEAREAAIAAGVPVGARGRLPKDVVEAFVLGTLASLVPSEPEADTEE